MELDLGKVGIYFCSVLKDRLFIYLLFNSIAVYCPTLQFDI